MTDIKKVAIDTDVGTHGTPPAKPIKASMHANKVASPMKINGKLPVCEGDLHVAHVVGVVPHPTPKATAAGWTVKLNGKILTLLSDPLDCGDTYAPRA